MFTLSKSCQKWPNHCSRSKRRNTREIWRGNNSTWETSNPSSRLCWWVSDLFKLDKFFDFNFLVIYMRLSSKWVVCTWIGPCWIGWKHTLFRPRLASQRSSMPRRFTHMWSVLLLKLGQRQLPTLIRFTQTLLWYWRTKHLLRDNEQWLENAISI